MANYYNKQSGVLIEYKDTSLTGINNIGTDISAFGQKSFEHMTSLLSIEIPKYVKEIRYGAFLGCTNLRAITFKSNSMLSAIDALAFYGCSSLLSIDLPVSLQRSDHYAFMHSGIVSATIPSMTVSALFPTEYTKIKAIKLASKSVVQPYTFAGCDDKVLKTIEIPNDISAFMPHAFDGFKMTIANTDGKKVIDGKWIVGYDDSAKLTAITCGTNSTGELGIIGEAFAFNPYLEKITINKSIKTVGSKAFFGCQNLREVVIANDSTVIADDAFEGCPKLTCVTATQKMLNKGLKNIYPLATETIEEVKLATNVKRIPEQSFEGLVKFNKVTFATNQITCIEPNAINVQKIQSQLNTDSQNIRYYQDWIFDGISFPRVYVSDGGYTWIPNAYKGIAPAAFAGNSRMRRVSLNNVKYIGKQAFADCNGLIALEIINKTLDQLKDDEGYPFGFDVQALTMSYYDYADEDVDDPTITPYLIFNNIDKIQSGSFNLNTREINVGSKCLSIEENALTNLNMLSSFDAGQHELSVKAGAFNNLASLTDIKFSYNTIIENNVFSGCNNLTSVFVYGRPYSDKDNWGNINENDMTVVSYETDEKDEDGNDIRPITLMKKFPDDVTTISHQIINGEMFATNQFDYEYNGHLYTLKDAVEIRLQSTIKNIDDYAFKGCTKLRKLTIKATLNASNEIRLGKFAFSTCYNLERLYFPNADTLSHITEIKDLDGTNKTYPWGYVGSVTQSPINIIII